MPEPSPARAARRDLAERWVELGWRRGDAAAIAIRRSAAGTRCGPFFDHASATA